MIWVFLLRYVPEEGIFLPYEPYFDGAGAGLGLTIVWSIVQAHDGNLTITARPDGGLRVSAVLPAVEVGPRDP